MPRHRTAHTSEPPEDDLVKGEGVKFGTKGDSKFDPRGGISPEESRTVSPARNPRRRSLSSSETTGLGRSPRLLANAKPGRNKGKTHRRETKLGGEFRGASRKAIDKARLG